MLLDRWDKVQPSSITREVTGFKMEIGPRRHLYQANDSSLELNNSYAVVRYMHVAYLVSDDHHLLADAARLFLCS